jgi:two-component system, cell cycle sensor histidine kinase and response regulator CckA
MIDMTGAAGKIRDWILGTSLSALSFLVVTVVFSGVLAMTLVQFRGSDALLILLIVPVLLASLYYRRWVYVAALGVGVGFSIWVLHVLFHNPATSLKTLTVLSLTVLGFSELLFRLTQAREEARASLQHSEQRFRELVEHAADALFLHDKLGELVEVNQQACASLGYAREELLGLSMQAITEQSEGNLSEIWQRMISEGPVTQEMTHRRKDGRTFTVEVRGRGIEWDGGTVILALARDVSERKNLESRLRHSQRMESVGHLAAGVAHDYNNILTIIQGQAAILLMSFKNQGQNFENSVREIAEAAGRATLLTKQLLTFSRKQELKVQSLDLNEVIQDVSNMLRCTLGAEIQLQLEFGGDLPRVAGDKGMLQQVLLNLTVNARDAMKNGGEFMIRTERNQGAHEVPEPANEFGEGVCLRFEDSGEGMGPETLQHIFEPFYTTKEEGKGTGLGLATVYGIVTQHSGRIEVESQLGKGTVFRIFLPAIADEVKADRTDGKGEGMVNGTETVLRCGRV